MSLYIGKTVKHEKIFNGNESMTVVGIRANEVELQGDYSGIGAAIQTSWMPIKGLISDLNTTYISAFPGTGKSRFADSDYAPENFASDSDSSKWPKEGFPDNYLNHLDSLKGKVGYVLTSTHKPVREGLFNRGVPFVLIYPDIELKDEYIKRYKDRGNSESFIDLLDRNWNDWIFECQRQKGCTHIVLKSGQYLSNIHLPR